MSAVGVTCRRTVGMVRSLYSTALALGLFFAGAGALFAFGLEAAEGGETPLAVVWALAVAPVLPVLAALAAMDVWSDERRTGRIDLLLTAPVRERSLVFGKFLGVWAVVMGAVLAFLVSSLVFLAVFAPSALAGQPFPSFLAALGALALQGALWCALSLAVSAATRHAAAAALTALALTVALPRGLWAALMVWAPQGRQSLGELPLDAHVFDLTNGLVSSGVLLSYALLTGLALFVTSKLAASVRLVGRGARPLRWSTALVLFLAVALTATLAVLAVRLNASVDLPFVGRGEPRFSARTCNILEEARGEITVTAFLSRRDARFRALSHFLRALSNLSNTLGGARLAVRYVDPRWDIGAAARLVRAGAGEDSLVFERGRRQVILPLRDGYGERICASAILRVAMPPQRRSVYWTRGHGELAFDAYGAWGLSDIARDLARDGYHNLSIDLSAGMETPEDCALIVVAGARSDFSRSELGWLDAYLRKGGRLLVMLSSPDAGGLAGQLPAWGLRTVEASFAGARTFSGTDVIVSDFSDHPVSAPMRGSQIVLERPVAFAPSTVAEGAGTDRIEYAPLARVGETCVAAVAERGTGTGDDLALRPTRIIAIGDAAFVMNGSLDARANANRDFFLNCVAYLSGVDTLTEAGTEFGRLVLDMDRTARVRFVAASTVALPTGVFLAALVLVAVRRRRG